MVVRIRIGKSIRGALNYNEQKVSKGQAEIVLAAGFACDIDKLNFLEKLHRFESLTERHEDFRYNTVHISLNFPPEEELSTELMQILAREYMERIGFGNQPYIVYRHHDANHPHIHIVTTNITSDEKAINLHNIAKDRSEPVRKALEVDYGLIQAHSRIKKPMDIPNAYSLLPAEYSRADTKHTITNIVGEVTRTFKFSDLGQLNAILRQFNVVADRGPKDSQMYLKCGLVYSILDQHGARVGEPIKASEIYEKPTLKFLQKYRFSSNSVKKAGLMKTTQNRIQGAISRSANIEQLLGNLEKGSVRLDIVQNFNAAPEIYFVDFFRKAVFTSEELGIDQIHLQNKFFSQSEFNGSRQVMGKQKISNILSGSHQTTPQATSQTNIALGLIDALLAPTTPQQTNIHDYYPKRKKKKKWRNI